MQYLFCRYDYSGYGASTGKVGHSLTNTTLDVLFYWVDNTNKPKEKRNLFCWKGSTLPGYCYILHLTLYSSLCNAPKGLRFHCVLFVQRLDYFLDHVFRLKCDNTNHNSGVWTNPCTLYLWGYFFIHYESGNRVFK